MVPTLRQRLLTELKKGPASREELSDRLVVDISLIRSTVFLMTFEAQEKKQEPPVIGTSNGKKLMLASYARTSDGNGQVPSS